MTIQFQSTRHLFCAVLLGEETLNEDWTHDKPPARTHVWKIGDSFPVFPPIPSALSFTRFKDVGSDSDSESDMQPQEQEPFSL
jgi:hypothetical protein